MRLGSLAFASLVLMSAAAWAAPGDTLVVTGNGVNVRSGPSTDAGVLTQVSRDQQVSEIERQGDWIRVEIGAGTGEQGWIHGSLLGPSEGEAAGVLDAAAQPGGRAAMPEPAEGPVAADLPGVARFRESVSYLNSRAQQVAGVDLFTNVEPAGEGVVRITTTDDWATVPPAGQRSYLNTLVDRWAAARGGTGPVSVQMIDASGAIVMEKSGGSEAAARAQDASRP